MDALFGASQVLPAAKTPTQAFVEAPLRWASKAHQLLGLVESGDTWGCGPLNPKVGPPHVMGNPNIYKPHNIVGIDRIISPKKNP